MKTANNQTSINAGMKVKSNIKAGGLQINHNQTVSKGLRVKSSVKAGTMGGFYGNNHNQTIAKSSGLRVKSSVKAGGKPISIEGGPSKQE